MISGVKTKKLRVIPDDRGRVMEILRADDEIFAKFGQVYVTTVFPGVVKAWHYHKKQTDNIAVAAGMLKLALFDPREESPTKGEINEFCIGVHNPILVQVPPGVYHGFTALGTEESVVVNTPTEPYNHQGPDEYRIDAHSPDIPYDWTVRDR